MQAVCRPCAKQVAPTLSPNAGTRRLGSKTERGKETAELKKPGLQHQLAPFVEGETGTEAKTEPLANFFFICAACWTVRMVTHYVFNPYILMLPVAEIWSPSHTFHLFISAKGGVSGRWFEAESEILIELCLSLSTHPSLYPSSKRNILSWSSIFFPLHHILLHPSFSKSLLYTNYQRWT